MWLCQVFEWINANSGFFQALFTLGLVFATVGLLIATDRYRRATEKRYVIEAIIYADKLASFYKEGWSELARAGISYEGPASIDTTLSRYKFVLAKRLVKDLEREFPAGYSDSKK